MLVGGVIDWKGKFTTNSNQPVRDVCARNGTRVPRIEMEGYSFQSNVDGVTLIGHYLQAFCEVLIDTLNHHGVMVIARNNMAVDVQSVQGFTTNTIELAVFVKDNGMAEPMAKLDFHDD
jgi:hypothetical protein